MPSLPSSRNLATRLACFSTLANGWVEKPATLLGSELLTAIRTRKKGMEHMTTNWKAGAQLIRDNSTPQKQNSTRPGFLCWCSKVRTVQRRDTSRGIEFAMGHQSTGGYSSWVALKAGARHTRRCWKHPASAGLWKGHWYTAFWKCYFLPTCIYM